MDQDPRQHFPAAAALKLLPLPYGKRSAPIFQHGSLQLKFYAPQGHDPQTPHTQDEVYIVHSGTGEFVTEAGHYSFAAGDALFVKAGDSHRFENFSPDFTTWVIFYGPDGGENPILA